MSDEFLDLTPVLRAVARNNDKCTVTDDGTVLVKDGKTETELTVDYTPWWGNE